MDDQTEITRLLAQIRGGDRQAAERLLEIVYNKLRRIAAGIMRRLPPGQTLQPTEVAHQAYLRMIGAARLLPEDRAHFFAVAARSMRQVLVDHARMKLARKRGGDLQHRVELKDNLVLTNGQSEEILALHEALALLGSLDARQARIVEMHYFLGNAVEEIAGALNLSERTIKRELQTARVFLRRQLEGEGVHWS